MSPEKVGAQRHHAVQLTARSNAPSESFFNSPKNERVHGTRYETRAEAEADLFEYIAIFYNRRRRHSTLGYSSPTQFLLDWLSKHDDQRSRAT